MIYQNVEILRFNYFKSYLFHKCHVRKLLCHLCIYFLSETSLKENHRLDHLPSFSTIKTFSFGNYSPQDRCEGLESWRRLYS